MKETAERRTQLTPIGAKESKIEQSIIDLIKNDHRKVEGLFKEFEQAKDNREKSRISKQIAMELTVHAQLEEQLVYPLLEELENEEAQEAYAEHALVKFMLKEINDSNQRGASFEARIKVLHELVKHHVKEEESEALPTLEKSEYDMDLLGSQFMERKMPLQRRAERGPRQAAKGARSSKGNATSGRKSDKASPAKKSSKNSKSNTVSNRRRAA